ncbi:protein of unknown function [Methylocaldum szegediense]|uniref:Uncharacterized protein n=1 Tax=Methylocaldum szegediense TaxID=73780 RepID=A0ABN8X169_9GAMM|nr:protein of unknown function [Methylocaldum szegediense]
MTFTPSAHQEPTVFLSPEIFIGGLTYRLFCWQPDLGLTMVRQHAPIVTMHDLGHTLALRHWDGNRPLTVSEICAPPGYTPMCTAITIKLDHRNGLGHAVRSDRRIHHRSVDTRWDRLCIVIGGLIGTQPGDPIPEAFISGILEGVLRACSERAGWMLSSASSITPRRSGRNFSSKSCTLPQCVVGVGTIPQAR